MIEISAYLLGTYVLIQTLILIKPSKSFNRDMQSIPIHVLIAFRNEALNLTDLFSALNNQTYPNNLIHYILIDDRSDDQSYQIAQNFQKNQSHCDIIQITDLPDDQFGKKNALKKGIESAKHDILIFTDADCIPDVNWIESTVELFNDNMHCVVGKSQLIPNKNNNVGLFQEAECYFNHIIAERSISFGKAVMSFGRNFAYRKSAFIDINGFKNIEQSMSGDDDLLLAEFQKKGLNVAFNANTQVLSKSVSTWHEYRIQKTRHMSVARFLPVSYQLFAAFYHGIHFAAIISIFMLGHINSMTFFLIGKLIIDLILFLRMNKILKYSHIMRVYKIWNIGYWLYIPLITIFSYTKNVNKLNWK